MNWLFSFGSFLVPLDTMRVSPQKGAFVPVPRTSAGPVSKVCGVFSDGLCVHSSTYERQTLTGIWRKGN